MSNKHKRRQGAAPSINPNSAAVSPAARDGSEAGDSVGPPRWSRFLPDGAARIVGGLPRIQSRKGILFCCAATLAMLCVTVPGIAWWPLAYICLVPWLICVCCAARAPFLYFASYLLGVGFYAITVDWMYPVTVEGYIALCLFFALQFPLAAWPIRHLYQKRGVSVAFAAPIVWTGLEYLRCIGPLGFPMNLLGHSHYRVLTMIQISDLVGAYGVSFVLAMINGCITDLMIQPIQIHRAEKAARLPMGTLVTLFVLIGTIIYGITYSSSRHLTPGPRVAMLQHDIPMYVDRERGMRSPTRDETSSAYFELAEAALKQPEKPDLVAMPETALNNYINDDYVNGTPGDLQQILNQLFPPGYSMGNLRDIQKLGLLLREKVQALADAGQAAFVVGATAAEWRPTALPPRAYRFNSAYLFLPGRTAPVARYDKKHIVLFGEYVPFRDTIPWLYEKLNNMMPFGGSGRHYSLCPGDHRVVFDFATKDKPDLTYHAGAPICYEEIMPYIAREFARGDGDISDGKKIDLLLPISNDGWFLHTTQLEQHLAAGVFRAIENRIAVARSVNTGASAMIYPNGKVHSRVTMSDEQIGRLDRVEGALKNAQDALAPLQPSGAGQAGSPISAFRKLLNTEVYSAYAAVGPGYGIFGSRLSRLGRNISDEGKLFNTAKGIVADQLSDDLAMVRRWRARPGTAPGFAIDRAMLDGRVTLYTRQGDWFSRFMLVLVFLCLLDWFQMRVRRNRARELAKEGEAS